MKVNSLETFDNNKLYVCAVKEGNKWVLPEMSGKNLLDISKSGLSVSFEFNNDTNTNSVFWINSHADLRIVHNLNTSDISEIFLFNTIEGSTKKYELLFFSIDNANQVTLNMPSFFNYDNGTWEVKIIGE